jgi:hypothetical protein
MNFTLAVLGHKKWIYPQGTLFHHGEARSYHYVYNDYIRNKMIAAYLYGGEAWVDLFSKSCKGRPPTLLSIKNEVIKRCKSHRELIKKEQKISIQDWVDQWT